MSRPRFALVPVAAICAVNLWWLRGELAPVHDLNDGSYHAAYVRWAAERISSGETPFDGSFPYLGSGYPIFHHYQVLGHLVAGAFGALTDPDLVYRVSLVLLLALWPVAVYAAARLLERDRWTAAAAAVAAPFVVSAAGYGYEAGSYVWRGYGMWSQLVGMWLLPLALALAWRAVVRRRSLALAGAVLGATLAAHFLTGYLGVLLLGVVVLTGTGSWWTRLWRAAVVLGLALAASAWLLLPAFVDRAWTVPRVPADSFWTDSYGAGRILGWLVRGELFDAGRSPVLSVLVAAGVLTALARWRRDDALRLLVGAFVLGLVLFAGSPTFGVLLDHLPVRDELLLHRMVIGVHLAGILLAGVGATALWRLVARAAARLSPMRLRPMLVGGLAAGVAAVALVPAWTQLRAYLAENEQWSTEQRRFEETDGRDLDDVLAAAGSEGRVFAGRFDLWQAAPRIGSVPLVVELLDRDHLAVGFTGRVPGLTDATEARFDDASPASYELFNVAYVLRADAEPAPPGGELVVAQGRFRLYRMPTSGWLRVVDTTAPIATTVDDVGTAVDAFARSEMALDGLYPLLAVPGWTTPAPTVTGNAPGDPGRVLAVDADPENGIFRATILTGRRAAVVVPVTAHGRWTATIDAEPAVVAVVAPGFPVLTVPAGEHEVEIRYDPIPSTTSMGLLLLGVSAVGLTALAERALARRRGAPTMPVAAEPDEPFSDVALVRVDDEGAVHSLL